MKEESSSCYCVLESRRCFVLVDQPGLYALVGIPISESAVKRLCTAVFGSSEGDVYTLRVYCMDDTPHAFQVTHKNPITLSTSNLLLQYLCVFINLKKN